MNFELFKSNVCHDVKKHGELSFIENTLLNDDVTKYWKAENYPCAFYTLAMLDYLSKRNEIPLYDKYDYIRKQKLEKPLYPFSVILIKKIDASSPIIDECKKNAIPEFAQYNILEGDIFNVY